MPKKTTAKKGIEKKNATVAKKSAPAAPTGKVKSAPAKKAAPARPAPKPSPKPAIKSPPSVPAKAAAKPEAKPAAKPAETAAKPASAIVHAEPAPASPPPVKAPPPALSAPFVSPPPGPLAPRPAPGPLPKAPITSTALTLSIQTSQGAAAAGNTQPANILVIVSCAGVPMVELTRDHFTLMEHFEVPGQNASFSNNITSFRNGGTGAYLLQTKPINATPWRSGHHLAQLLVSSGDDQQGHAAFKIIIR